MSKAPDCLELLIQPAQDAHLMISSYLRIKAVLELPAHPAQRPLPVAQHAWLHSICPHPCVPFQVASQPCCSLWLQSMATHRNPQTN